MTITEIRRDGNEMPTKDVFRAGSALRMYVEAPLSVTGFRQLPIDPTPAMDTIHVGAETPSRLVLPVRPGSRAPTPLPACDRLVQPALPALTPAASQE